MDLVENTGGIVPEPDWTRLLRRKAERVAASGYWQTIIDEMKGRQTLSPANGHAVKRLVMALVLYDRTLSSLVVKGTVNEPAKDNPRAIPRINPYFTAAKEAAAMIAAAEVELGLTPRRRASAGKVSNSTRRPTSSSRYLKPINGGRSVTPSNEKEPGK